MTHIENKACQLREEAKRRIKSAGFLKSLFSKTSNKTQESIEYYKRAGNLFKMAKNWNQAGAAFYDAANVCYHANDFTEAALNFVEAGQCFRKCNTLKAIHAYQEAIKLSQNNNKFGILAQYLEAIGEILEDDYDHDEASNYFERAAIMYKQDCRYSAANKCLEKIAEHAALSSDYVKAIKLFEDIACFDLASSVHKYQAKHYFFRAAICLLCAGTNIDNKLCTYINMYPAFQESREYQLVHCLAECLEAKDLEKYENIIRQFDSVSELSQWHVTLLLRAKRQFEKESLMCLH